MDAQEALAKFFFERAQGVFDQQLPAAMTDPHIATVGLEILHVRQWHQTQGARHQRREMAARVARHALACAGCGPLGSATERRLQALKPHRLQQVIDRLGVESGQRVNVKRSGKDHRRRHGELREVTRDFQPVHARHLNIQQHDVHRRVLQQLERCQPGPRFYRDDAGQQFVHQTAQPRSRQRLIVNDGDLHASWTRLE